MSTDRNNRPLKPMLASNRTASARPPLTPRVAGSTISSTTEPSTARPAVPRVSSRAPLLSPRGRPDDRTGKDAVGNANITPRSSMRNQRGGDSGHSPAVSDDTPTSTYTTRSRSGGTLTPRDGSTNRNSVVGGISVGTVRSRTSRPNSAVGETRPTVGRSSPLPRSSAIVGVPRASGGEDLESRFFHASDAKRQEFAPKKAEPKKAPTFLYADGHEDTTSSHPEVSSPRLSAVADQRPFTNVDMNLARSPPIRSPCSIPSSISRSYFPPTAPLTPMRSPSPSKENIHLSYRRGASQIFGMRPVPRPTPSIHDLINPPDINGTQRSGEVLAHRKSSSLSSVASGKESSRRRSNTAMDDTLPSSPLTQEIPRLHSPSIELKAIDTSLASLVVDGSPPEGSLSPTKTVSQLATDARRERKVLDLEISNSSLLAINASLERELRRQKTELKRFRRLSRAGRLSSANFGQQRKTSTGYTLGECDDDESNYLDAEWDEDDMSDSEEDSMVSGSDVTSSGRTGDRLAKDEERLKVDLQRHRELLTQSQAMNQSLKRCMCAADEMIRDGKKALEYHVRVSDVKLGGRILTGHEDDEDSSLDLIIDEENDGSHGDGHDTSVVDAKGLLDVWEEVGRVGRLALERTEMFGDRDSGIEVDQPIGDIGEAAGRLSNSSYTTADPGQPP